jgi:Transposase, Mutator family
MADDTPSPLTNVITIDDERIKSHLDRVVRGSVEETLNALLDAEADRLCNAQRYERSEARRDTRAGQYERNLQTKAGEVRLKVPKLRQQTFETAIIERYRRRESSVEEALIEMYLAGVSVRRVEDITEALWGTRVSPSWLGTALSNAFISRMSTMEVSSTTRRSQSSGCSRPRRNPPVRGSTSSKRWIVRASIPVASLMRLEARPVGAHKRSLTPLADKIRRIELTKVVLPTPGPPVITRTLVINASRTAAF